jgi:OOP family OmpA-OmpF porin
LALGVAGLGFWANGQHAGRMEAAIAAASAPLIAGSVHGATVEVKGRDIHLNGIIDGTEERDTLVAGLDAVPGRRVVLFDTAKVLEKTTPFTASLTKAEGGAITAIGHVPTEAVRTSLAEVTGAEAVAGLTLAAGSPPEFAGLAMSGAGALAAMVSGEAVVTDTGMTLTGKVLGPDEKAAVEAALAGLAPGAVTTEIEMLDDGTPPAYEMIYSATDGATLTGKLPKGLDAAGIAGALGLKSIAGTVKTALLGEAGNLADFGAFQSLLPLVETMKLSVTPTGRSLDLGVQGGIDPATLTAKLQGDLPGHDITVSAVTLTGENGATRINAATGTTERFMGGFWVGIPNVEIGLAGCQAAANGFLGGERITFLSGSDELDASAIAVINGLAGIMARCVEEAKLKATIGGHTDNVGDPTANLGLSQRRATAVRRELIARGVPGQSLVALGYGNTQPVADNSTDDGRANNRRTSIEWAE